MANVPITLPSEEKIGVDQHARSECVKAKSRKSAHNGSAAMADTITCSARYAAVPHEPTEGPMKAPAIASVQAFGRFGAPPCRNCLPVGSINRIEAMTPDDCSSTNRHKLSRISASESPLSTI